MPITSRFVVRSTIGLLAVGFLALIVIEAMTVWLSMRAQVHFAEMIAARDIRASAVELRRSLLTAESSQRGFLVTGNEIYLAPYSTAKSVAQREWDSLKRALVPYHSAEVIDRLTSLIGDKFGEMDQTIALKSDRRDAETLAIFRTNRGKALMDEANVFLSSIVEAADDRLTGGVNEQRSNASALRWVSDRRRGRDCAGGRRRHRHRRALYARGRAGARRGARPQHQPRGAGGADEPPISRGRATTPKSCSRKSITASLTACRLSRPS